MRSCCRTYAAHMKFVARVSTDFVGLINTMFREWETSSLWYLMISCLANAMQWSYSICTRESMDHLLRHCVASAVAPVSHSFRDDDMIIKAAFLLLHLLLLKCMRSTNTLVSSHTTRIYLPKSDNEMACCLIRMSASSCDILDTVIYVITVIKAGLARLNRSIEKIHIDLIKQKKYLDFHNFCLTSE